MFMKLITTKVIPFAARNCPGMKMVPIKEIAPYYHVYGILYLVSFSNKSIVNLMKEHEIDYILLPLTDEQIGLLLEQCNHIINNGHHQIPFNEEKRQKRKTKSNSIKTPSAEELKVATAIWLKCHKPDVLCYKV